MRLLPFPRYHELAGGPEPEALAAQLKDLNVSRKAAKRIDDYERIQANHREHIKAQIKVAIGAVGVVLGTAPAIPGLYHSCGVSGLECGLRLGALLGSLAALGVAIWSAYDLSTKPSQFAEESAKLSKEMSRAMQCSTGEAPVPDLFSHYRTFTRDQQIAFKIKLHEASVEPKRAVNMWRHAREVFGP